MSSSVSIGAWIPALPCTLSTGAPATTSPFSPMTWYTTPGGTASRMTTTSPAGAPAFTRATMPAIATSLSACSASSNEPRTASTSTNAPTVNVTANTNVAAAVMRTRTELEARRHHGVAVSLSSITHHPVSTRVAR